MGKTTQHQQHLNLEDIARLSGSSRSTVSRVVNNHPNVKPETRDRILRVIQQYHYQPNSAARALASQRSDTISVIIPHVVSDLFRDPFFPTILQALTSRANQLGFSIMLGLTSGEMTTETFYKRIFGNQLIDGFIIASAIFDKTLLECLNEQHKAYVVIGRPHPDLKKARFVDIDNYGGAYQIVEYLIQRGYKRIGFIPGRSGLTSSEDRQSGYEQALEAAGIPLNPRYITKPGNYLEEGGYECMQSLLQQDIDAVFCASDMMAVGAIRAIKDAGLQIPQDIAVVGFDDTAFATRMTPPLTTMRQDVEKLGQLAIEVLIGILNGNTEVIDQKILPTELIARESA